VGGTAVFVAIQRLKEKAHKIAAHMLGVDTSRLSFEGGRYAVQAATAAGAGTSEPVVPAGEAAATAQPQPRPTGRSSLTIQEIALAAHLAKDLPPDTEPGLSATYFFEPKNFTFPFGTHIAVVEVDRETGDITFLRYVAVDDCGKVINPLLVDGQVHGGIVQSIGQAMYEEIVYDDQGQLVTGTLMDYAVPRASDIPHFELDRTETPSPVNPLGVKGVGEAGTIGATPAIVGAIVDALAPFGVKHLDMPIRPEAIWRIMRGN
jgi:carbon-monoxide dehydrogenase large subunit